ncbi:hypothetical protein S40285_02546 [Stachybotrys chlorohalonatus IBT 40285]|uniref:Gylcosyl hydrolase 115 C-terminal domain-containing protein n=1 Tax=Stachybotrys chlorohalonatus (strain IBT 40285) TaxID=1283841 RepID=A0A084QVT2_STAC4|nr:hypothetical protein S40285_02546 [Stachybotrys chlorohalonata IBT 40285]
MRSPSILSTALAVAALGQCQMLFEPGSSDYQLADDTFAPTILVSGNEAPGVARAAGDLAADFGRVVGQEGTVAVTNSSSPEVDSESVIIVGTIGRSSLIDVLVSDGKLDVSEAEGQWESYVTRVVEEPFEGISWAYVIAGSDRRGAIYGLYDISEQIGVSPWYYWADVAIKTKTGIWVEPEGKYQKPPSVKYRGLFINDENPALLGWVGENFNGVFGADFYKLVFELILRLKGNYLWPAMWGKSFYTNDPASGGTAHEWGVVMGTSHHEPMARSEREQQTLLEGNWDWTTNREGIQTFFREGIERAKDWDTMWTMGMRGSGDVASPTLTAETLEDLITVQQTLLSEGLGRNLSDIPQTWVLYKEVSDYYVAGLEVPDTVTLLWTDDNSGNIIRVPIANETDRLAGAGVYYHFDYVGAPRSYKWINTVQLVKTWEQMHLAYNRNARQIWIANVGDLKPLEVPLAQFMDMAYDFDRWTTPESTTEWLTRWAGAGFDASVADETAAILNEYGVLVGRRKYELLSNSPFAFSTIHYDEAERNLAQWTDLLDRAQAVYDSLAEDRQVSFWQTVLHPIMAGKTVVDLYTKAAVNALYLSQARASTNVVAQQARDLFAQDAEITDRYHTENGGKWNHFVNQAHIGYTTWSDPPNNTNIMPTVRSIAASCRTNPLGVAIQGTTSAFPESTSLRLRSVDPYMPPTESRWLEVFARRNATFAYSISSNASYVTVSNDEGRLSFPGESDVRSIISVDWDSAPDGLSYAQLTVSSGATSAQLLLPVNKTSVPEGSGFVESNGVIAIDAAHFTSSESANGVSYVEIPHYGRTLSGVKAWPVTIGSQTPGSGPALRYSVYTTTTSSAPRLIVSLGASHNHDPTRPLAYAYSLDGADPVTVRYVATLPPHREGPDWSRAVVANGWTSTVSLGRTVSPGAHELSIWLLEPGVVLQKIALDLGGYRETALGPPESRNV